MLRHVALFRWKPEATAENIARLEHGLSGLPAKIPAINAYHFGRNLGIQQGNADFAVVADFADQAGFEAYTRDPVHQAVINERLRPILAHREAIQYIIDRTD